MIKLQWDKVHCISKPSIICLLKLTNATYRTCSPVHPSRRRRSHWRGRTEAASGCNVDYCRWTLSFHKVEVFQLPPLLKHIFVLKKGKHGRDFLRILLSNTVSLNKVTVNHFITHTHVYIHIYIYIYLYIYIDI